MKKIIVLAFGVALTGSAASAIPTETGQSSPTERLQQLQEGERYALLCFKTGETVDGMNKICFYDCAGSAAAITVGAASLCPLSIDN